MALEFVIAKTFWVTYLICSFIVRFVWKVIAGFAKWLFNKFVHSSAKSLSNAGAITARESAANLVLNSINETVIDKRFEPADAVRLHSDDEFGWGLMLRQFSDRIERTMKVGIQKKNWMRLRTRPHSRKLLEPFTPEIAAANSLPFTFGGAIQYTEKELGRKPAPKFVDPEPLFKEQAPDVETTPTQAPSIEALPATPSQQSEQKAFTQVFTGTVKSAAQVKIEPEGRKAYRTFQVTLRSRDGHEENLTGVELETKHQSGAFKVGDDVSIARTKETFLVGDKTRTKNIFSVTVIKSSKK
jgi:hypothetical protein